MLHRCAKLIFVVIIGLMVGGQILAMDGALKKVKGARVRVGGSKDLVTRDFAPKISPITVKVGAVECIIDHGIVLVDGEMYMNRPLHSDRGF